MPEPARYILHRLDFTDGTAIRKRADWQVEFLPANERSAALMATPLEWPFDRRTLGSIIRGGWRGRKQVKSIHYEIRAGRKATRYHHPFKARPGAPRVFFDGRRLWAEGGKLFLSYPLRALTQRGGSKQRAIQFIN